MTGAPSRQFGARHAIDMDLPSHCREGLEIILTIDRHPRQSVTAVDLTRRASAQRPIAVIQGDLRHRAKDVLAHRLECDGLWKQDWHHARTKDVGDPALGGSEAECTISGRDQPPGKADPFSLVTVEQLVGRTAGQNPRQLPGKIYRVADPGVHPLPAGGAVNMSRIAEQEGATLAEMFSHAVMDMIGREPVHRLHMNL